MHGFKSPDERKVVAAQGTRLFSACISIHRRHRYEADRSVDPPIPLAASDVVGDDHGSAQGSI